MGIGIRLDCCSGTLEGMRADGLWTGYVSVEGDGI